MKAKDTAMSREEIKEWVGCMSQPHGHIAVLEQVAKRQAEITGTIMFKAGMREVMEWINSHQLGLRIGQDLQTVAGNECPINDNISYILLPYLEWQAFLKKNGLEGK